MKPGTLAAIHRVRLLGKVPTDGSPYVADCRSYDINETICAMIRNAAPGLVAVTLSPKGGPRYVKMVERAARKRGIRVLWWTYGCGPKGDDWVDLSRRSLWLRLKMAVREFMA